MLLLNFFMEKLKILIVDLEYDYGQRHRGINQIGTYGFRDSFKALGHQVESFYYDKYLNNTEALQSDVKNCADNQSPDLIFFCLYQEQFYPETLKYLKERYITVNWFGDDNWRFSTFSKKYAPYFTWSITTDPYCIEKYHALGITNVHLSQWAAIDRFQQNHSSRTYEYEVSFVGGVAPVRKWIISELAKKNIKVNTFGNGWDNGAVSLDDMNKIFYSSKINLNLSNSGTLDIRYFIHNPRNIITAIRSTKNSSQVKARNFEIPFAGGFLLTDYVPDLESYFDIGREICCYSNVDEIANQINYYLKQDDLREKIRIAGEKRARTEHTYLNRVRNFLCELN